MHLSNFFWGVHIMSTIFWSNQYQEYKKPLAGLFLGQPQGPNVRFSRRTVEPQIYLVVLVLFCCCFGVICIGFDDIQMELCYLRWVFDTWVWIQWILDAAFGIWGGAFYILDGLPGILYFVWYFTSWGFDVLDDVIGILDDDYVLWDDYLKSLFFDDLFIFAMVYFWGPNFRFF